MLEQFLANRDEGAAKEAQMEEEQKQFVSVRWKQVPWYELLTFPRDWVSLSNRRLKENSGLGGPETDASREARKKLNTKVAVVDFSELEFEAVVQWLRDVSGLNVYVKWSVLAGLGIDQRTAVSLHLNDVTAKKALDLILQYVGGTYGLSYVVDDEGVVWISTKEDLAQNTVTKVYDVRDLMAAEPNFVAPHLEIVPPSGSNGSGGSSGGGGSSSSSTGGNGLFSTQTGAAGLAENTSPSETINRIKTLITTTVDPSSWQPTGTVGSIDEWKGELVITQTPSNHEAIASLISQLREASAIQVSIEARFITVQTGFLNDIGFQATVFLNTGSSLGSGTSIDPWTQAVVPNTSGSSAWPAGSSGNPHWTPLEVPVFGYAGGDTSVLGRSTGVAGGISVSQPSIMTSGTFLDDLQVNFIVQATQANQTTRTLTAPRVTVTSGKAGHVAIGRYQSYISGYDVQTNQNVVAYIPQTDYVQSGVILDVTPTVSADRRYVHMRLEPTLNQLNGLTAFTFVSGDINTPSVTIQQPDITQTLVRTIVTVPDGATLLIGGQKLAGELEMEKGVPMVSKIPIVNRLFTNRGAIRDDLTLLILIKPTIIVQREEELKRFPGLELP